MPTSTRRCASPTIVAAADATLGRAVGGTPQATADYMREEVERWHKVIKAANVKLD